VVLVQTSAAPPLAGSVLGFLVGSIVKYCLNYGVTFQSTGRHSRVGPRFVFLLGTLFLGNAVLFWLLNSLLGLNYIAAQVTTTLALVVPGYIASRKWVFLR
jgi:putative flippase GtrA